MTQNISLSDLAKMIDHSLLHPTMTDAAIIEGCELAKKYNVAIACTKPYCIRVGATATEAMLEGETPGNKIAAERPILSNSRKSAKEKREICDKLRVGGGYERISYSYGS